MRIEISFLNRNYLKKSSEIQKAFKMAKENIEQTYFEKCVLMAVEDINQDYETGTSGIAESEYKALIHAYESMLHGENAVFQYRAKILTQMEQYLLIQKMSKGLLFQQQKSPKEDIVAFAIQLKKDADLRQLGAIAILNNLV